MAFKKRLVGSKIYYIDNDNQVAMTGKDWSKANDRYAALVARLAAQKILNE